jgi:hypothetical protein
MIRVKDLQAIPDVTIVNEPGVVVARIAVEVIEVEKPKEVAEEAEVTEEGAETAEGEQKEAPAKAEKPSKKE